MEIQKKIELFKDKNACCGCEACVNICPQKAVSMKPDEYGFLYPEVDDVTCIGCEACVKVCRYQNVREKKTIGISYVAVSKKEDILLTSASGGAFTAIAQEVIEKGGVVVGCSMEMHEGIFTPEHIMVREMTELPKLQGSKYVQSRLGAIYKKVKQELQQGTLVLFSGTPCQVAGLKGFLFNKSYENLLTIDIICHGVPSVAFFQDYIANCQKKIDGKIVSFNFRDKMAGWGHRGARVDFIDINGTKKSKFVYSGLSSYYKLFLRSDICRINCYTCKYASIERAGDITLGDYWGIAKEHPEYLMAHTGNISEKKGVSCLIVNTEQGKRMLEKYGVNIDLKNSTLERVANGNSQLKAPCRWSKRRKLILDLYKNQGYLAVEEWFLKNLGVKKYIFRIWLLIPRGIQNMVKRFYMKVSQ